MEELLHPDQLEGELNLAPGFLTFQNTCITSGSIYLLQNAFRFPSPPDSDYVGYHRYVDQHLPQESPHLYGLHPNAEIGFLTATSEKLFKTVFELQPRESGDGGGASSSREKKVKTIVDDILEKMPDPFRLHEMMAKCEDKTPYIVVCFQVTFALQPT